MVVVYPFRQRRQAIDQPCRNGSCEYRGDPYCSTMTYRPDIFMLLCRRRILPSLCNAFNREQRSVLDSNERAKWINVYAVVMMLLLLLGTVSMLSQGRRDCIAGMVRLDRSCLCYVGIGTGIVACSALSCMLQVSMISYHFDDM